MIHANFYELIDGYDLKIISVFDLDGNVLKQKVFEDSIDEKDFVNKSLLLVKLKLLLFGDFTGIYDPEISYVVQPTGKGNIVAIKADSEPIERLKQLADLISSKF
jgi:hypothetical protein